MKIFKKITDFLNKEKPFVVYRKPNSTSISGFFIENDALDFTENYIESGFVFAPFDKNEKAILFPLEKADFVTEKIALIADFYDNNSIIDNDSQKHAHIQIVEKAIEEIKKTELQKIVISRREDVQLSNFDLLIIYQKLLQNYQNAFVYVWFHPKVGLWLGATPETLLNIEENYFKTMSLAGTQVYKNQEKLIWKNKELEEQQLVTDFIETQLKDISSNLKIDKTETIKAGNLLHLRTKVEGSLDKNANLKLLVNSLHPTPAVCGLPRKKAKQFILDNENYDRSFYTGFLGEINLENSVSKNKSSELFVNLRCMSITNNIASIYVGGGITKDSDSKKEWEETVSKSKTIKNIL